jgi:AcrR family transcriptional regulator
MEAIARGAEISFSTLYRSFPTKDSVLLAAFRADAELLAEVLEGIPAEVPANKALGIALLKAFEASNRQKDRTLLLGSILDVTPSARAGLWDLLFEQRERIGRDLAKRLGLKERDPRVVLSARVTLLIAETAADIWRSDRSRKSPQSVVSSLIQIASEGSITLPGIVDK